jgi:hypothetical protein
MECLKKWKRSPHAVLSHYINAANTKWDEIFPFFLMAYRATPNTKTGYSPFFLLHGREITLPSNKDLKEKMTKADPNLRLRIANLKWSLKQAYKTVSVANKRSHQANKR